MNEMQRKSLSRLNEFVKIAVQEYEDEDGKKVCK